MTGSVDMIDWQMSGIGGVATDDDLCGMIIVIVASTVMVGCEMVVVMVVVRWLL